MAAAHRLRQGMRALLSFAAPIDYLLASEFLTPTLLALFRRMSRSEKQHSLNVLRAVFAEPDVRTLPPDERRALAVAALLHDVGKSRYPLALWQRTLPVLARKFLPAYWFARWSRGNPQRPWTRGFVVYVQHPAWSAEMLRAAGAPPLAVWLVAHHQDDARQWRDDPRCPLLKRLQAADDTN